MWVKASLDAVAERYLTDQLQAFCHAREPGLVGLDSKRRLAHARSVRHHARPDIDLAQAQSGMGTREIVEERNELRACVFTVEGAAQIARRALHIRGCEEWLRGKHQHPRRG